MADVFGTPAEQIILQGTQLLQSAFRARSQIMLEREKLEEEKKQHRELFDLQKQKLELERESLELEKEQALAKAAAGKDPKALEGHEVTDIRRGLFGQARQAIQGTLAATGLGDVVFREPGDLERQINESLERERRNDEAPNVPPSQKQAYAQKEAVIRKKLTNVQHLLTAEMDRLEAAHPYRKTLAGGGTEIATPTLPPAPIQPIVFSEADQKAAYAQVGETISKLPTEGGVLKITNAAFDEIAALGRRIVAAGGRPDHITAQLHSLGASQADVMRLSLAFVQSAEVTAIQQLLRPQEEAKAAEAKKKK